MPRHSLILAILATALLAPTAAGAANTGANEQVVDLRVPPAVNGIAPPLRLAYSSRVGLGPVGYGWQIQESAVRLDLSDRVDPWSDPQYLLDGKRLVRSTSNPSRLVPEIVDGSVIEEVPQGTASAFRVYRPDGWMHEYGGSHGSRIEVCAPTCRTTEARLSRAVDPHGLEIRYEYADLGDAGMLYLLRIDYALDGNSPVGDRRELHFSYGHVAEPWTRWEPGLKRVLGHRLNKIEMFAGEYVRSYLFEYDPTEDAGWTLASLTEEGSGFPAPTRPVLAALEYSGDAVEWESWDAVIMSGDDCSGGAADPVHDADSAGVQLDWFDLTGDGVPECVWHDGSDLHVATPDTDADGVTLPGSYGATLPYDPATDLGLDPLDALREIDGPANEEVWADFLDFDGDGLLDRVVYDAILGELTVQLGDHPPLPFAPAVTVALPSAAAFDRLLAYEDPSTTLGQTRGLIDLNGDRRPDYVRTDPATPGVWRVWLNEGMSFAAPQDWTAPGPDLTFSESWIDGGWELYETRRALVDLNADGFPDYVNADPGFPWSCAPGDPYTCVWSVSFGTGEGWVAPVDWDTGMQGSTYAFVPISRQRVPGCNFDIYTGCGPGEIPMPDEPGVYLADLNGDTLPDLVREHDVAFGVAGHRFGLPWSAVLPTSGPYSQGGVNFKGFGLGTVGGRLHDMNGDGFADWLTDDSEYRQPVDASGAPILPPHLLTAVTGPFGGRTEYSYAPAVGHAADTDDAHVVAGDGANLPLWNLAAVTHSEPDVGDVALSYGAPRVADGRFLGYETVTRTELGTSEETSRTYHVDALRAGRVASVQRTNELGDLLSAHSLTWTTVPRTDDTIVAVTARVETLAGSGTVSRHLVASVDATSGRYDWIEDQGAAPGGPDDVRTHLTWLAAPHPHAPGGFGAERVLPTGRIVRSDPTGSNVLEARTDLTWSGTPRELRQIDRWADSGGTVATTLLDWDGYGALEQWISPEGTFVDISWSADYLTRTRDVYSAPILPPLVPLGLPTPLSRLHRVEEEYAAGTGALLRSEYGDGLFTVRQGEWEYDAFGRLLAERRTDPDSGLFSSLYTARERDYGPYWTGAPITPWADETTYGLAPAGSAAPDPSRRTIAYLDPFGRTTQTRSEVGPGGEHLVTWLEREADGSVWRISDPVVETSALPSTPTWSSLVWTESSRQAGGREWFSMRHNVDAAESEARRWTRWDVVSGELLLETETEQTPTTTRIHTDALDARGRRIREEDALGTPTLYAYDALGRIQSITDMDGNVTTMGYDLLGRQTLLADPDLSQCAGGPLACPWAFEYDDDDRMTARVDAEGNRIEFGYDALGRVLWQTGGCELAPGLPCSDPGQGTSFFFYDGVDSTPSVDAWELGGLTSVWDPSGSTDLELDHWGRTRLEDRVVDGEQFLIETDLDTWGQLHRVQVSHGATTFDAVLYDYDLRGNLISVDDAIAGTSWLDGVQRDPNTWRVTGLEALGGDVRKHLASYAGGALSEYRAQTTLSGTPVGWDPWIQEVALSYDVAGRVAAKTDRTVQVAGSDAVEEFGYDALDRLTSVGGAFAGYTRSYAYDALGNLDDNSLQAARYGGGVYDYDPTLGGPHAVKAIGTHTTFAYDDNGFMTFRERTGTDPYERHYTPGSDGRLRQALHAGAGSTGGDVVVDHLLDASKQRVKKTVTDDGVVIEEVFTPSPFIELGDGVAYKVVFAQGSRLGETEAPTVGPTDLLTLFFEDHLGQQAAALSVTHAAGTTTYVDFSAARRDPYGVVVDGDEDLFSRTVGGGQADPGDEALLGVRSYDAEVGRFLQSDTASFFGTGQGLNRYRYAWNSPTNYADPSGFSEVPLSLPYVGGVAATPVSWSPSLQATGMRASYGAGGTVDFGALGGGIVAGGRVPGGIPIPVPSADGDSRGDPGEGNCWLFNCSDGGEDIDLGDEGDPSTGGGGGDGEDEEATSRPRGRRWKETQAFATTYFGTLDWGWRKELRRLFRLLDSWLKDAGWGRRAATKTRKRIERQGYRFRLVRDLRWRLDGSQFPALGVTTLPGARKKRRLVAITVQTSSTATARTLAHEMLHTNRSAPIGETQGGTAVLDPRWRLACGRSREDPDGRGASRAGVAVWGAAVNPRLCALLLTLLLVPSGTTALSAPSARCVTLEDPVPRPTSLVGRPASSTRYLLWNAATQSLDLQSVDGAIPLSTEYCSGTLSPDGERVLAWTRDGRVDALAVRAGQVQVTESGFDRGKAMWLSRDSYLSMRQWPTTEVVSAVSGERQPSDRLGPEMWTVSRVTPGAPRAAISAEAKNLLIPLGQSDPPKLIRRPGRLQDAASLDGPWLLADSTGYRLVEPTRHRPLFKLSDPPGHIIVNVFITWDRKSVCWSQRTLRGDRAEEPITCREIAVKDHTRDP